MLCQQSILVVHSGDSFIHTAIIVSWICSHYIIVISFCVYPGLIYVDGASEKDTRRITARTSTNAHLIPIQTVVCMGIMGYEYDFVGGFLMCCTEVGHKCAHAEMKDGNIARLYESHSTASAETDE